MRIALVYPPLFTQRDGIGRLVTALAGYLVAQGHAAELFFKGKREGGAFVPYSTDARVRLHDAGCESGFGHACSSIRRGDFDAVCVFYAGNEAVWGLRLCGDTPTPLVMSEHYPPEIVETLSWSQPERYAAFARAALIHMLQEGYRSRLPQTLAGKARIIGNPIFTPVREGRAGNAGGTRKTVIAAGRLDEIQKRFSLLLQAFAILADEFADWDLRIFGEGLYREYYEDMIRNLHLQGRVFLPGNTPDLPEQMAAADMFAIPSAFETFGMVAAEAQACGLPCAGFADCGGVNGIIINGETGILAAERSPRSLADAMRTLMADEPLREKMGVRARELAARFAPGPIFAQWETLLAEAASMRNAPGQKACGDSVAGMHFPAGESRQERASCGPTVAAALRARLARRGRNVADA